MNNVNEFQNWHLELIENFEKYLGGTPDQLDYTMDQARKDFKLNLNPTQAMEAWADELQIDILIQN